MRDQSAREKAGSLNRQDAIEKQDEKPIKRESLFILAATTG
jgi:hypothetical protein